MNRSTILRAIQKLPPDEQKALLRDMLALLSTTEKPFVAPKSSRLAGLFANGKPSPSDDDVARWLDEHRSEKYGQS
jgi:hypothetical protein